MEMGVDIAMVTVAVTGFLLPNILSWAASYKIKQVRKRHSKLREEGYSYARLLWLEEAYTDAGQEPDLGDLVEIVRTNARARATRLLSPEDRPWAYAGIDEYLDKAVESYARPRPRENNAMVDLIRGPDTWRHVQAGMPEGAHLEEMYANAMERTYVFIVTDGYRGNASLRVEIREEDLINSALHREHIPEIARRITEAVNLARHELQHVNPFAGMPATYDGSRMVTVEYGDGTVRRRRLNGAPRAEQVEETQPSPPSPPSPEPPSPTRRMIRRPDR